MEKRTEISELGQFGLIAHIKNILGQNTPPDDAAILQSPNGQLLASTEIFVEGIHFDLAYTPLAHLGYKLVAAAASDLAAMNALPQHILMGLAISNRFSVEAISELYVGVKQACADYALELVAGDTSASRSGLIISISTLGAAPASQITRRNGANTNDIICVTGDLGAAYLGLQILEREKAVFTANPNAQPELADYDYVIGRQLKPNARLDIVRELQELQVVPTAMIDLSDGLASDLMQLCRASGTGAHIFEDKLPIDDRSYLAATALNLSPITAALNGGEDYELLFTIAQADYDKIKNHPDITSIGYMVANPATCELVMKSGQQIKLQAQGFSQ
jgi:thiamine-monophosphate kinase